MPLVPRLNVVLALIISMGFAVVTTMAKDPHPEIKYEIPMTKAAFDSELGHKAEAECNQLYHLMLDPETMFNADKRKALLGIARPLLIQYRSDLKALDAAFPGMSNASAQIDAETTQRLALLGDENTISALKADVTGPDVDKSLHAQCFLIYNDWTLADGNAEKQAVIADHLTKLDQEHPESGELSGLTMKLAVTNAETKLHDQLTDAAVGMNNPVATKLTKQKQIRDASKATKELEGKPFTLTGKTAEGKDFTTADWRGKVVMVDFWATWCAPCKQQLPTIEKMYVDDHDKGLEIVSVSNDYDLDTMKKFIAANHMPWPELVDSDAMKAHTWNSITFNNGIDGIPHVFVLDRKGNLLTADAGLGYQAIVEKALAEN